MRKNILKLMLAVICIIFVYNYILIPVLYQYNSGMRMGMGMRGMMMNNNYYYIDFKYIIFILLVIVGFILYFYMNPEKSKKCVKCGYEIKNDKWSICPICGSRIHSKRGDS